MAAGLPLCIQARGVFAMRHFHPHNVIIIPNAERSHMADADLDVVIRKLAKQQYSALTSVVKARRDHCAAHRGTEAAGRSVND